MTAPNRTAAEYKAVAAFLQFLGKPENDADWTQNTGYVPVTFAGFELSQKQGYYEKNPGADLPVKQLARGTVTGNSKGLRLGRLPEIRNIIQEELEKALQGGQSAQQAMDSAVSARQQGAARVREVGEDMSRLCMERRTIFDGWFLPVVLVLPQLLLTAFFFLWPAGEAIWSSLTRQDPFGLGSVFVGLENFAELFTDPLYVDSIVRTVFFCAAVSVLSMSVALLLAVFADHEIRGRAIYRTLLIWPYAIAPAISAVLWLFILNPQVGLLGRWLNAHGMPWDYTINGGQALLMVMVASAWKQVSYNFIFFLAGLQSIPRAVTEAARMDGANGWHRFRTITFPLLAPTTFFLLVVNLVYAAFDTFGTIYALTHGGPGKDTETLVIKVYRDGVVNLDLGSSSAQSVVLMVGRDRADRDPVPLHGPADQRMSQAAIPLACRARAGAADRLAGAYRARARRAVVRTAGVAGRGRLDAGSGAITRGELSLLPTSICRRIRAS